jgi:ferric-dicitrate binding protein FerR (iron transport regulator)
MRFEDPQPNRQGTNERLPHEKAMSMGHNDRLPDLFKKLVDDKATEEEVRLFLEMIREDQASNDLQGEMEALWKKVGEESAEPVDVATPVFFDRMRRALPLIAATFAGLLMVVVWFLYPRYHMTSDQQYVVAKAAAAKTTVVYLADGSKVTLNSGSSLRYPNSFGSSRREVYLEGEAYFEVKHNPEKSFLVHTGKVTTTVLGTSFNVAAYNSMPTVAVTVITGKVGVNNGEKKGTVLLSPKQRATLNTRSYSIAVDSVGNLSDAIAWTNGKLVFSGVALDEVCLKLGYHFGTEVSFDNTLKSDMKITGSFSRQPLSSIVEAICELSNTRYKRKGAGYIIY